MTTALIAPHNDDETLFAAYTLQRETPHVIVVLRDPRRARQRERERETQEAVYRLTGAEEYEQWTYDAALPRWSWIQGAIAALVDDFDRIYAPAYQEPHVNGYDPASGPPPTGWGVLQHDYIGYLAQSAFGDKYEPYCMYTRWYGRHEGHEVVPAAAEIACKLEAMSQYVSAMEDPGTRPWFVKPDLREFVPVRAGVAV